MKHFFLFFLLLLSVSCSTYSYLDQFNDVETYINDRPDSALFFLQSVDTSRLTSMSSKCHYNLLLAQAKDKCFIDECDDSIMLSVVNYYSKHKDYEKLFKSYYYLARIQQNDNRYLDAMYSFTEAEQLLCFVKDDYAKGLLYAQIGALYYTYLDFTKALEAFRIAYCYYEKAEKVAHMQYTTLDIGNVFFKMNQFNQAEQCLSDVLNWARANNDNVLCLDATELLCLVFVANDNVDSLYELIGREGVSYPCETLIINGAKAYLAAAKGNYSGAHQLINASWTLVHTPSDSCMLYHMDYLVNKKQGNYKESLTRYESLFVLQDSIVRNALQKPLHSVQQDYFKSKSAYDELLLKSSRNRLILIFLLCFCLIVLLIMYYIRKIERKNREISTYVDLADELRHSLENAQNVLNTASLEKESQDTLLCEMSNQVAALFYRQYEMLDKLSTIFYETHGRNGEKEAIFKQVKNEIENLSSNHKYISQLEDIVNEYRGNVMAILRKELDNLDEMDFRLLCFLFAGFSAKAISIFTGNSVGNIYMKKNRIKNKISKLSPDISSFILSRLS